MGWRGAKPSDRLERGKPLTAEVAEKGREGRRDKESNDSFALRLFLGISAVKGFLVELLQHAVMMERH